MSDGDVMNLALAAAVAGAGVGFTLTVLGGLVFFALDLVRGLWGRD